MRIQLKRLIVYSLLAVAVISVIVIIIMGNTKSIGNSLIFPAPKSSYDEDMYGLIWIPNKFGGDYPNPDISLPNQGAFPALYIPSPEPSNIVFIYLHGNRCDIGTIAPELRIISYELNVSIIAVEYTGYGLVPELYRATSSSIDFRVVATFRFLLSLNVPPSSIVFYGRSIGTGPAAFIASYFVKNGIQCGGVILQAPYMSIHKISQKYFQLAPLLIDNFWDTEKSLEEMAPNTPLLIIHGIIDEIIPVIHGQNLFNGYKSKYKMADFQPESLHNVYIISENIVTPVRRFLDEFNISGDNEKFEIDIPDWCYHNGRERNLGRKIHRRTQLQTFASSLQDLCQRESIKNDDISDIVNDARNRTITNEDNDNNDNNK